jgi:hypothetical protein
MRETTTWKQHESLDAVINTENDNNQNRLIKI